MGVAFRSTGTAASGIGAVTPGLPAGHLLNDILIMPIQAGSGDTLVPPTGWSNLAQGGGTSQVIVCWKRDGGSESAPTLSDAGNHQIAQIYAFSGCFIGGTPYTNIAVTSKTASTQALLATGGTTFYAQDGFLGVVVGFHANDSSIGNQFNTWLNPGSVFTAALTEASGSDVSTSSGTGGGFALGYATVSNNPPVGSQTVASNTQFATIAASLAIEVITFTLESADPPWITTEPMTPSRWVG